MTGETPRHRRAPARSEQRAAAAAAAPWAHGARGGLAPPTPQQQQLSGLAALMAQGGPGGGGWATLPPNVLSAVFDSLELKSLAAAASVCTTWRYEASLDARWRAFWQQQVSDVGLWQWAKAAGGYRQQLRAKQLVRRGECVATVFPFSRRDGPVDEVLCFDGGPADADKRILTVQAAKAPGRSVRLSGSTLKVWDARALLAQRPLLVVHDVLKHMQLEGGQLFLWRIKNDACVRTAPADPDDPADEARRWAEHPALVPSVLDPGTLALRDVPLEASYGRGVAPCEWLDMSGGMVAGALMVPSQGRLLARLFDLASGRCLRAASCPLPPDEAGLQLGDHEVTMAVTRSGDAGSLVVATCALFDTRVFVWTITAAQAAAAAAAAAAARGAAAAAGDGAAADADGAAERLAARRAACWDPAAAAAYEAASLVAGDAAAPAAAPAAPAPAGAAAAGGGGDRPAAAGAGAGAGGGSQAAPELRHAFTTPDLEPVVDLSISTAGHRLFIIGMESIFVADLCGAPYLRVSTLAWRGLVPPGAAHGPADVGAFSWPLPNRAATAFYLDATNSLFIAELGGSGGSQATAPAWYAAHTAGVPAGRRPSFDCHSASKLGPHGAVVGAQPYWVQAHTDLRPPPRAQLLSTLHGRAAGPRACEPAIVEYVQDGGVIFTTADSSCPAVASLLQLERAAGSYLAGLGPASVAGGSGSGGARRAPFVARGGKGARGQLAPRALVLIDASTGCRFKAVPVEGAVESVHSAGQYLVASVAELAGFPASLRGSIVVLDFAGEGFGLPAAADAPSGAAPAAGARRRRPAQRAPAVARGPEGGKQRGKQAGAAAAGRGGGRGGGGKRKAAAGEDDAESNKQRSKRARRQ